MGDPGKLRRQLIVEGPIGSRPDDPWFTIVDVTSDVRVRGAHGTALVEAFVPYWQMTEPGMNVILKTDGDPALLAAPLRRAVAALLVMVGAMACMIPARRATRVDPMIALRAE